MTSKPKAPDEFGDLEDAIDQAHVPLPLRYEVSGLYARTILPLGHGAESATEDELESELVDGASGEHAIPDELAALEGESGDEEPLDAARALAEAESAELGLPTRWRATELRLDVDGRYPQMTASGNLRTPARANVHWIARLKRTKPNRWAGRIWYTLPAAPALPYTAVIIRVVRSLYRARRRAVVSFLGHGVKPLTQVFRFRSRYFHPVQLEFDGATGATQVVQIDTGAHPNRPAALPSETLSLQNVYRRAGFNATTSGAGNVIPSDGPDPNATWSDAEMHDAMQVHWSRFADAPQWALWVLFARLHDMGTSLGGVMFDDIGPNHRQGTAIFSDAFISQPPAGDANPAAWVARMRFWTAAHEMGHSFNLAHSWQKTHPPSWGTPWIPTPNEPEARSFMNYPYNVAGGQEAFFADFEYRFSDSELLFMRHAPSQFVQMGNAAWFDQHGFEQAQDQRASRLSLELGVNRKRAFFRFLEPVVLELKLRNLGDKAVALDRRALSGAVPMTVIVKRRGAAARRHMPYAHYCLEAAPAVLRKGDFVSESLFVSAGLEGWDVSEPGEYLVQAALHLPGEDVISAPLSLRVASPESAKEESLAQDYFSDEVGRVLAFDGSQHLRRANDTLRELVDAFGNHPAACHAQVALAVPLTRRYQLLADDGAKFTRSEAKLDEARKVVTSALLSKDSEAAETLGHVDYGYYVDHLARAFDALGDKDTAKQLRGAKGSVAKKRAKLDADLDRVLGLGAAATVEAAE